MILKPLNSDNFILFAMKQYRNSQCESVDEFYEDLNRIKYIKRLFKKYDVRGELKERLILNHMIILNNVFGSSGCSRILFFKIEEVYHSYLKTFLEYLKYLPIDIPEADLDKIPTDNTIITTLEGL
ncbi:TPA: hypothetical protein HA278_04935 [Candidatus Woesearchaeota archaeon]|nr:hypothetical protein [Candidatus Woesearchaeota archaeon]